VTDNGNYILDFQVSPIADAARLELDIRAIPGAVGTGLFLELAGTVVVGDRNDFRLLEEKRREPLRQPAAPTAVRVPAISNSADSPGEMTFRNV
jgi:hypothetical protein